MALSPKPTNPYRKSLRKMAVAAGFKDTDVLGYLTEHGQDAVIPAGCTEGCQVEPDGECSHGCPSILLAAGLI